LDEIRYSSRERRPDFRFVKDKRRFAVFSVLAAPAAGSKRELCRLSVKAEAKKRRIGGSTLPDRTTDVAPMSSV
jgi:hypothetical protein